MYSTEALCAAINQGVAADADYLCAKLGYTVEHATAAAIDADYLFSTPTWESDDARTTWH